MGDGKKVPIETIRNCRLLLKFGVYLDLNETFVAPSFRQNLVSISNLDKSSYSCSFRNNKVSLFHNSNVIGISSLIDNLYIVDTVTFDNEILHTSARGTKQKLNENSTTLWHKRLGHISKQRIQRLVDNGILGPLDLTDF